MISLSVGVVFVVLNVGNGIQSSMIISIWGNRNLSGMTWPVVGSHFLDYCWFDFVCRAVIIDATAYSMNCWLSWERLNNPQTCSLFLMYNSNCSRVIFRKSTTLCLQVSQCRSPSTIFIVSHFSVQGNFSVISVISLDIGCDLMTIECSCDL